MTYRISYDDALAHAAKKARKENATRTEEFRTEQEALGRARQLLDDGTHHAVSLRDASGNVLCGVRLQLKLGFSLD